MARIVVVLAALAVACSNGSGGGSGGSGSGGGSGGGSCTQVSSKACFQSQGCNPCSKITDAQAKAALGGLSLTPGMNQGGACEWDDDTGSGGSPTAVAQFNDAQDYGTFEDECHPSSPPPPGSGIQVIPVSGVGDDACFVSVPGGWSLEFLEGCAGYSTSVLQPTSTKPLTDAQMQGDAKALALDAVPNL